MTVYKVHVSQFVEETAVLTIEAPSLPDAIRQAQFALVDGDDIDWQDGDAIMNQGVYQVTDDENNEIWPPPL